MTIRREFLGWDQPCLHLAAGWLDRRYAQGDRLDLSGVLVVVPGRRSGRRLLEVLVEQARAYRLLVPPRIVTVGELPELLYEPAVPIASGSVALLSRLAALQGLDRAWLQRLVPTPPADGALRDWLALAQGLGALEDALAAQAIPVHEVIARCEAKVDGFQDQPRWEALAQLRQSYEQALAQEGLQDRHTARFEAIQANRCGCEQGVVLVATADLHRVTRLMLRQLAGPVTALIHASPEHAEGFDDLGCLVAGWWLDQALDLDPAHVYLVDQPVDQCDQVLRVIGSQSQAAHAATGVGLRADQITVGLGDPALGALIEHRLDLAGVAGRLATGRAVAQSRPALLLAALGRFASQDRLDDFAALLRHPDLEGYLVRQLGDEWCEIGDDAVADAQHAAGGANDAGAGIRRAVGSWLTLLDRYATDHLQARLTAGWLGDPRSAALLKAVYGRVLALLGDDTGATKPLAQWSQALSDALIWVYGHEPLNRSKPDDADLIHALEAIGSVLRDQAAVVDRSVPAGPTRTKRGWAVHDVITLTLAQLAGQEIPPQADPEAVEALGWLELQLDDAPVLVVTGVNEGLVPTSSQGDAFLPDGVRRVLGLEDDRHRYARDRMMLQAILASRPHVTLIAGRYGLDGTPLAPSRLLLAGDADRLAPMVERFYRPVAGGVSAPGPLLLLEPGANSRWVIPPPQPHAPITRLPITAFRDYLACPYRFYLKRVLKLQPLDDQAVEMDGRLFGIVLHEVLAAFGKSDVAGSTDGDVVRAYLFDRLNQVAHRRYGPSHRVTVRVQCEQLRYRLAGFARWQADQNQQGWRIVGRHVEQSLEAQLEVDGQPFTITGQIDRIDRHPDMGYRVLDYKSSQRAQTPEQRHREAAKDNKRWVDLQLPLYRVLAQAAGIDGAVAMGYIQVPKDGTKLDLADWSDEVLESALEQARGVIRAVRAGCFWPPAYPAPRFAEDFAGICMDRCPEWVRAAGLSEGERLLELQGAGR